MKPKTLQLEHDNLRFTALEYKPTGKAKATVICVHGFPDNQHSFDEQIPALLEAGYRVICPALRGYEPDSIRRPFHLIHAVGDMVAWMDKLKLKKVHYIGHDWGGVVGYLLAAQAPDRLRSLNVLSIPPLNGFLGALPGTPKQFLNSWYIFAFQLRGIAEKIVKRNDYAAIAWGWKRWSSPGWEPPMDAIKSVQVTLNQPRVLKAALDYYRSLFKLHRREWYETFKLVRKPIEVPTMILCGQYDGAMRPEMFENALHPQKFTAGVAVEELVAGHWLHRELPDECSKLLLEHLTKHS